MFHITVSSAPPTDFSLEHDLRMVKAALLYADKVKLCSPISSFLVGLLSLKKFNIKEQLDLHASLISMLVKDKQQVADVLATVETYKVLFSKKRPSIEDLFAIAKFRPKLDKLWSNLLNAVNTKLNETEVRALIVAIEEGVLDVHLFGLTHTSEDERVDDFIATLMNTMSDGSTYPLFDDILGNIIHEGLKEGELSISETGLARGRHCALAARLLERLPLFEHASVNEILDIHRELETPLKRFRSVIIKFSEKIKTAAWDAEFSFEAEQVCMRDVEPAILDIEEAVRSNNYLATLTRRFADKPLVVPGGSALALLMSQLSAMPSVISQAIGVGAASGLVAYDAFKEWRKQQQTAEQNQLYFYYRAGELLADRTYEYQ